MITDDPKTQRAGVARDNAFRDLALTMHKMMGPILAIIKGNMLSPSDTGPPVTVEVALPHAPGQVHDLIRSQQVSQKQLEIAIIVLVDKLVEAGHLDLAAFLEECAKRAEETEKVLNRGLLSAGAISRHVGGIIRPS